MNQETTAMEIPENLPENTVALIKLPVPVYRITALCEMFRDPTYDLHQEGDWIVVTKEVRP